MIRAAGSMQQPNRPRTHLGGRADLQETPWLPGNVRARGTCAHGRARILNDEIDAQSCDDGTGVVSVQTVKGKAVVEQSRRLLKHLTSHLKVHLGPCPGYCLCCGQELIERWA